MNGVILYQSKYGATKRYAEWLSEETGFQCIETKKADINEIIAYDVILLGGGISFTVVAHGIWTQCLSKIELCAICLEKLLQRKIHLIMKYGKRH